MTVYLHRHAKAGSRSRWEGPDDLRPLSTAGRAQAGALVDLLGDEGIEHIVSSPSVRCRQSVEPLAEVLRLPVDLSDALVEGAPLPEVVRLVEKYGDDNVVVCTHGDVIPAYLEHLVGLGIDVGTDPRREKGPRCEKGSTWIIETRDGEPREARYLPPPST